MELIDKINLFNKKIIPAAPNLWLNQQSIFSILNFSDLK